MKAEGAERIVVTTCASHCGGSCVLKLHVRDGVVTRIETDEGEEPQLRACLRGRAYRQRVYAPDRVLHPLKRIGERGEGKFERISWDEAIDTVASELVRVRDRYGPASILYMGLGGDASNINTTAQMACLLASAGGYTSTWGLLSFHGGIYAQQLTYGTHYTSNTRDDLVNSRLILMWGWNPTSTVTGVSTTWHLTKAREGGTRIIVVDPRYTDSAAAFAHEWIPIRPATDGAMLLAMAFVMIEEKLHDQTFLDRYTFGFDKFRDYVMGKEDGVAKTPRWAESISGVPAETIARLAREFATTKPAALIAGIAPGRTSNGDQYHRIAIALAAMTGNVGIHGGDAAGRSWESLAGGFPYQHDGFVHLTKSYPHNPVEGRNDRRPRGTPIGYRPERVHMVDVPDFIEKGKAGGFPADCKLIAFCNMSYVNDQPNVNRVVRALKSKNLEFVFVNEQFLTPTTKFADIVLPSNTFFERSDFARGVGLAFYGAQPKAIEPLGESKSQSEIAHLLAKRLGVPRFEKSDEDWLDEMLRESDIPDRDKFVEKGLYRLPLAEPFVAFEKQIADPAQNPFRTPTGKIEIYSTLLADLGNPDLSPIPTYVEGWEGWNDPLRAKYPLQMISTHFKRRANTQFENIPWLRELDPQVLTINTVDAEARGIKNGDLVRVFNDRGEMAIPARVTERIMPGVVEIPHGAWYDPDEKGVDHGGCPNVLTRDAYSPGGSHAFNTTLVEVALR